MELLMDGASAVSYHGTPDDCAQERSIDSISPCLQWKAADCLYLAKSHVRYVLCDRIPTLLKSVTD